MTPPHPSSPHAVLGVPTTASLEEVERAWKKLARKMHPDLYPPEERDAVSGQLAIINAAWANLKKMPKPKGKEHAYFYTRKDPHIETLLKKIEKKDASIAFSYYLKNALQSKKPKRLKTPTFMLSSALIIEDKNATILFEAPKPTGRVVIIYPELKAQKNQIQVIDRNPQFFYLPENNDNATPFNETKLEALGLRSISLFFPPQPTDITKTIRMTKPANMHAAFYG